MSDTPPVEPLLDPAPAAESPAPEPIPTPEPPPQKIHPWTKRSFGFEYGGKWLEGTAYHAAHNLDASGWYGQMFYESLEELMNKAGFAADQQPHILSIIQRLVR